MFRTLGSSLAALLLISGCSAIVSPDTDRLGLGPDGAIPDADLPDAPPPGRDTGVPDASVMDSTVPDATVIDGSVPDATVTPDGDIPCEDRCNDGVDCTTDECAEDGSCIFTPNDELCADGERCNRESGCVPAICTADSDCNDGLYCNGEEACDPMNPAANERSGCVSGEPIVCDDGLDCTADSCNEDMDICDYAADDTLCDDGIDCTGDRCDADRGCVHDPDDTMCDTTWCRVGGTCDATEGCVGGSERDCRDGDVCTADTCNEMLMMCENEARDEDGDGAPPERVRSGFGFRDCPGGTDCDDSNPDVGPTATEYCNGRDDDCDDRTDESCTSIPDTCATARAIMMPASGAWTETGRLNLYSRNFNTLCDYSRGSGPDAVYYLDVTESSDIVIDTIGSTADTVLSVDDRCGTGGSASHRFACNDDLAFGDTDSRIFVHAFGPEAGETSRRLYIVLQGYRSTSTGEFTINVRRRAAAAGTCSEALDITGGGSVWGEVPDRMSELSASCGGGDSAGSPEGIFSLAGPSDGTGRFRAYSADFDPIVHVRQAPCSSGMEVGCAESSRWWVLERATIDSAAIPSGTRYYAAVDGGDDGDEYWLQYTP